MPIRPLLGRQAFQPTSLASAMLQRGQMAEEQARQQTAPWAAVVQKTGADAAAAVQAHQQEAQDRPGKLLALHSQMSTMQAAERAARKSEQEMHFDYLTRSDEAFERAEDLASAFPDQQDQEKSWNTSMKSMQLQGLGREWDSPDAPLSDRMKYPGEDALKTIRFSRIDPTLEAIWQRDPDTGEYTQTWGIPEPGQTATQAPSYDFEDFKVNGKPAIVRIDENTGQMQHLDGTPIDIKKGDTVQPIPPQSRLSISTSKKMWDPIRAQHVTIREDLNSLRAWEVGGGPDPITPERYAILEPALTGPEEATLKGSIVARSMLAKYRELAFRGDNPLFVPTDAPITQKVKNVGRIIASYFGKDPQMRVGRLARAAVAAQLAVAQQGARPSDFDTKGTWLPLIPHPAWNTHAEALTMMDMLEEFAMMSRRTPTNTPIEYNRELNSFFQAKMDQLERTGVRVGDLMLNPMVDANGRPELLEDGRQRVEWLVATVPTEAEQNADEAMWETFSDREESVARIQEGYETPLSLGEAEAIYDQTIDRDFEVWMTISSDPNQDMINLYGPGTYEENVKRLRPRP